MNPVAVITDYNALSFREVSTAVAKVLCKNGVDAKVRNLTELKIPEKNIICVGNIFHLSISYLQRFIPEHNVIFYAITEGIPILDSMSRQLSEKITYITPSNYTKQCLEQARLTVDAVIPHGIDINSQYDKTFLYRVKTAIPQPSKVAPSNVMLCVAGNWRRKAIDKLMIATKIVEKIMPDSFLILHSGIGDLNIVSMQHQLELSRFWLTNLWGVLSQEKLQSLFALCDFYVQPSFVEGFGLTFLEAMRWLKPVIAVDCPAQNEIIKHGYTGLLLPVTKTEEVIDHDRHAIKLHYFRMDNLVEAMIAMCDGGLRAKLAENIKKEIPKWSIDSYKKFEDWLK